MKNRFQKLLRFSCIGLALEIFLAPAVFADDAGASKSLATPSFTAKVSDKELSGMRGGFFTAAGAQFDFGANVTTLLNGNLALSSTLNWTPTGLSVQQTVGTTALGGMGSDPLGLQAGVPNTQTQVFSNLSNGQLQNFVVNSASNQSILQNTNISLTIYNFADWQQNLAQNTVAARLASDIMTASGLMNAH